MAALLLLAAPALEAKGLGYALSGGGARGFAQIGMLKVLEEQGIYPDQISGTSIGALVGAFYALGYSAAEMEQIVLELDIYDLLTDRSERRDLYIGQKRWPSYGNPTMEVGADWVPRIPPSIFLANRLNLRLAEIGLSAANYQDFSRLPVPFSCLATDLGSGRMKVFDSGSLMQALRSSISIPTLFVPFAFDGHTYIDGGVSQNLPVEQVLASGADAVVGFKTNTDLHDPAELDDLVGIVDQTINIGMTRNLYATLHMCDLVLEPELELSNTNFNSVTQLIAAGEAYARSRLPEIIAFRDSLLAAGYRFRKPEKITFLEKARIDQIACRGNEYVSTAKIIEYTGLEKGRTYTPNQLAEACLAAWNSQVFQSIYPVLEPYESGYNLIIFVRERQRRNLTLNVTHTTEEGLNVRGVLELNNLVLKNSKLLAGLTLGGRTELSLDYVKNFGEFWGSYFRLFPYLSENLLYFYDADGYKVASARALEYGITPGVGVFANKLAIAEAFFYSYRSKLYREMSLTEPVDSLHLISGLGLKLYHESLDDDIFPLSGVRAFAKANLARWEKISDQLYSRFVFDLDVYSRFADFLSLRLGLNYGTYFGAEAGDSSDPFHFCGSHGYRGYQRYEVSSPQYKIYTLGLASSPFRNFFAEAGVQGLETTARDIWSPDQDITWSVYGDLGYRSPLGPIRVVAAVREKGQPEFYLNIGHDLDVFWFSRK